VDYKVIKPFGKYKKGNILRGARKDQARLIRRKLQEDVKGDETILPVNKAKPDEKMIDEKYENKMVEKSEENKKKKGG
jgi:hypothetical protein